MSAGTPQALLATGFGLTGPVACTALPSLNHEVFLVESGPVRAVLKVYGRGLKSLEELRWERDLLAHLRRAGLTVPAVLSAAGVEPFVVADGRPAVLYEEIAGRPAGPDVDAAGCRAIGAGVGAFYAAAADFRTDRAGRVLDLSRIVRQGRALLRIRYADRPAEQRDLLDLLDESERRLARLIGDGLDWGVCQGDVTLDNMRVLPDGTVAMLDFENVGFAWRAADLCGFQHDLLEVDGGWAAFLDGLTGYHPLGAADLRAIDWMLVPFWLYNLRWLVKAGDGVAGHLDRAVTVLRGWAERRLHLDPPP